ncbi:MAG: 16S rRNA (adenine(1518)-N(6)/adenine(1519)-N(6))-dimethyltransferase RsmA [Alphaproteobacteria bacterium]|nr:16S rRNA (adenine(1518)-N(6)/adenine(1519)-N(6))-dimethyltransferase RsmA [Alphaproteobacteria bacterium]
MAEDTPPPLPPLREVIRRHGLAARKALGQNFLLDLNLTRRIARGAAPLANFNVVEVGPGPGGLTRALLLEGARRVVAIERDQRCLPALAELAAAFPGRLEIVPGDALAIDPTTLVPAPRKIVANLPYNIATPLLLAWLPRIRAFADFTLMFQKEVAARLAAKPDSRDYGRLSVLIQWLAYVERLFDVAPTAFVPPPKVTSTVVRLTPRPEPQAPCDQDALERVTAAAFGQRRKMLRQSLKSLGDPLVLLHYASIDPTARAEDLTVAEFCALARALITRSN